MKDNSSKKRIGCILASIHTGTAPSLWSHLVNQANRMGEAFFIFPGGMLDAQTESEFLRNSIYKLANPENIDALISWGSTIGGAVSVEELNQFHENFEPLPMVTIGHKVPRYSCVDFDAYSGMKSLVQHFIRNHGSRRIAFLRGPESHVSAGERYRAFLDVLKEENLLFDGYERLITEPFLWSEGEKAVVQLYEERHLVPGQDYDTLIGSSDLMLFSAVRYLQRYGFRIPQDVRVAAFNDSTESRIFSTQFTTVHMPYAELGRAAFTKICKCLENPLEPMKESKLSTQLVIRESCGCNKIMDFCNIVQQKEADKDVEGLKNDLLENMKKIFQMDDEVSSGLFWQIIEALQAQNTEMLFNHLGVALNRFFVNGGDVRLVFNAFVAVQESPLVKAEYYSKISRGIYHLIIKTHSSVLSFNKYESEKRYAVLNSLKCDMLSAHDRKELISILREHLVELGITSLAIVLYENDEFSKYIGGFSFSSDPEGKAELHSELFPSKRLVPVSHEKEFSTETYVVQPLFIENQPLGYIITNVPFFDGVLYEDLRSAISSSLHGIFLFEQTLASKKIAERAEHAKTEFFANVGADLSDPLEEIAAKLDQLEATINSGDINKDILSEQLLFIRSQVNAQLEKTNMLVDLTLSQVDDLAVEKRLFNISEIFPEIQNFPVLYGDPDQLTKAFSLIREEYNFGFNYSLERDGVHLVFAAQRISVANWAKPSMLFAEKIILLQFGELIAEKDFCSVVLPYPNLASLAPSKSGKIPERIISFSEDLEEISSMKLPIIRKTTGNYSEFSRLDKIAASLLAWKFDDASMKDIVNMYSLRHHPELFRAPMLCFVKNPDSTTLLDLLENAVRSKREEPILFIDSMVTSYEGWAKPENVIAINSMADFDSAVSQILPSLIVFEKVDINAIKAIRRRPDTVLVPILILPETIVSGPEADEVCALPRLLLCNRGVASSAQFAERIRGVLNGDEILPPHTGALVKKAILYLNENASAQIVRWKLADSVHVSEDYLTRIFHKEIGLSLWEYLNRYRIFLATDLLLNTNGTIYEIAEQTGFQDQAYFCRVFKKIHGVPPGKIRNKSERRSE